jgi:hypothetical protein
MIFEGCFRGWTSLKVKNIQPGPQMMTFFMVRLYCTRTGFAFSMIGRTQVPEHDGAKLRLSDQRPPTCFSFIYLNYYEHFLYYDWTYLGPRA